MGHQAFQVEAIVVFTIESSLSLVVRPTRIFFAPERCHCPPVGGRHHRYGSCLGARGLKITASLDDVVALPLSLCLGGDRIGRLTRDDGNRRATGSEGWEGPTRARDGQVDDSLMFHIK
jgi:hypothetical protein